MLLNILLLIFCAIPFGVSMSLYKNNKRFMTPFYMAMARSGNARKLYVQVWLICLLLFHYVYAVWNPTLYRCLCRNVLVPMDGQLVTQVA